MRRDPLPKLGAYAGSCGVRSIAIAAAHQQRRGPPLLREEGAPGCKHWEYMSMQEEMTVAQQQ